MGGLLRMHSSCFCCRSNDVWFWKEQGLVSLANMNFQKWIHGAHNTPLPKSKHVNYFKLSCLLFQCLFFAGFCGRTSTFKIGDQSWELRCLINNNLHAIPCPIPTLHRSTIMTLRHVFLLTNHQWAVCRNRNSTIYKSPHEPPYPSPIYSPEAWNLTIDPP